MTLGRSLHQAGLPSHRLEAMLFRVAGRLGTTVHAFSLPTGLLLCIGQGEDTWTTLVRLPPCLTDLGRLRLLTIEAEALADGRMSPAEAVSRIETLSAGPAAMPGRLNSPGWSSRPRPSRCSSEAEPRSYLLQRV